MRKIFGFLTMLLLATIFTQNACAEAQYGSIDFDQTWGNGRIDFAIFDFESQDTYSSWAESYNIDSGDFASIAEGEYIYAYKLYNDDPLDDKAIFSFEVFANGDYTIDVEASIDSFSDSPDEFSEAGVEPTGHDYYPDTSSIIWEFGDPYIEKDEYSWFLMLKSTLAPVTGDFVIKGPEADIDGEAEWIPGDIQTNPEPATIALFGLGSLVLFRKRKIQVT